MSNYPAWRQGVNKKLNNLSLVYSAAIHLNLTPYLPPTALARRLILQLAVTDLRVGSSSVYPRVYHADVCEISVRTVHLCCFELKVIAL